MESTFQSTQVLAILSPTLMKFSMMDFKKWSIGIDNSLKLKSIKRLGFYSLALILLWRACKDISWIIRSCAWREWNPFQVKSRIPETVSRHYPIIWNTCQFTLQKRWFKVHSWLCLPSFASISLDSLSPSADSIKSSIGLSALTLPISKKKTKKSLTTFGSKSVKRLISIKRSLKIIRSGAISPWEDHRIHTTKALVSTNGDINSQWADAKEMALLDITLLP